VLKKDSPNKKGKKLVGVNDFGEKVLFTCNSYPNCNDCKLRFRCWTDRLPHFRFDELEDAGLHPK